jgi:hypothetical protein
MVRPFLGEEVKVERDRANYQDERRGALEETDNYRVCLILKYRPNLRAFIPWGSIRSIEHDNQ